MGLLNQFGGVKKHGWQIYKKNVLLVDEALYRERIEEGISPYFTEFRSDWQLALYLGDRGLNVSYLNLYCSKGDFERCVLPTVKAFGK